jgi:hypothetical protein
MEQERKEPFRSGPINNADRCGLRQRTVRTALELALPRDLCGVICQYCAWSGILTWSAGALVVWDVGRDAWCDVLLQFPTEAVHGAVTFVAADHLFVAGGEGQSHCTALRCRSALSARFAL